MSAVADALAGLALGAPQTHQNLTLAPLLGDGVVEPGYRLLDEALAEGCPRVTAVAEGGSVPELRFVNGGARPVRLLDGEELLGAKQNRVLNLTLLAPAHTAIVIPVSGVEAGRWHAQSADFASAGRAHDAAGRGEKAVQVSAALSASGARGSDQGQVWEDIAAKSERARCHRRPGEGDRRGGRRDGGYRHPGSAGRGRRSRRARPGPGGALPGGGPG